jgi:thioesterase domain-containing protein
MFPTMNNNQQRESIEDAFKRIRSMDASLDKQLQTFSESVRQRRPDSPTQSTGWSSGFGRVAPAIRRRSRASRCRPSSSLMKPDTW